MLAYKECFATEAGKIVLHDLARAHNMFRSSFREDALKTVMAEGERNVVLRIFALLNTPFKEIESMMKEEADE